MAAAWDWLGQFMASGGSENTAANWISFWGWVVAILTLALSLFTFGRQSARERRVELQENYLRLELESNEFFRFEAEHGGKLGPYRAAVEPKNFGKDNAGAPLEDMADRDAIATNFFLQQLNLFEIAARFRRDNVFAPHIFGSWVIWYYDVTRSWWFREKWVKEYSDNYTEDLYHIFTPMARLFDEVAELGGMPASDDDDDPNGVKLKAVFFEHAAGRFHCPIILENLKREQSANKRMTERVVRRFFRPVSWITWKVRSWFRDSLSRGPKAKALLAALAAEKARSEKLAAGSASA